MTEAVQHVGGDQPCAHHCFGVVLRAGLGLDLAGGCQARPDVVRTVALELVEARGDAIALPADRRQWRRAASLHAPAIGIRRGESSLGPEQR
ncbi:MAG TPA: hypothetical protein PKB06_02495, partial [Actinotalea sp.]|nr:hypothetical protein [Actinotalea sp.]